MPKIENCALISRLLVSFNRVSILVNCSLTAILILSTEEPEQKEESFDFNTRLSFPKSLIQGNKMKILKNQQGRQTGLNSGGALRRGGEFRGI